MLYGTLVTVVGFVPIGFAQSGVGEYAGNIFWVLMIALLVSWLVAVTFTPYLGVKLLPSFAGHAHKEQELYSTPLYRWLRALITGCVHYRKTVVVATFALLALAIAGMAGPVQKQFFPSSDRTEVLVSVWLPQGSAIRATDATIRQLEAVLAPLPELKSLSAYVGAGAPRFFISANPEMPDPAFGKIIAVAQDTAARDRVIALLQERIAAGAFPQARIRVSRLLYGPPVIWPVEFRLLGPDPAELRRIGH